MVTELKTHFASECAVACNGRVVPEYSDLDIKKLNPEAFDDFMTMCDLIHCKGSDASVKAQVQYSSFNEGVSIFGKARVMAAAKGIV